MNKIPDYIIEKVSEHEMILQHAAYLADVEPYAGDAVHDLKADNKIESLVGIPDDAFIVMGFDRLSDARAVARNAERDARSVGLKTLIIHGSGKYRGLCLVTLIPRK